MKKYVLNIDKLYSGQTANALVLNQVDKEFPILIPSLNERVNGIPAFIAKWKRVYPDFNPPSSTNIDAINEYIVEFNLGLQAQFKRSGHKELYMMDDTQEMKPNVATIQSDKIYMHNLNGLDKEVEVNSSQLNVLFPYRKMSSKSPYASQLKVQTCDQIDEYLERARAITLQGKVSYIDCIRDVQTLGGNLYVMSPTVELSETIHGNGLTIVNGISSPYHFPSSLTLFQTSKEEMFSNEAVYVVEEFEKWYKMHNRRTVVSLDDDVYGGNVSKLKCLDNGSYELVLATYSPTDIIDGNGNSHHLGSDTFQSMRYANDGSYKDGKYVFDNGKAGSVGIMFNMFDTFISGKERILRIDVPIDKEYNRLQVNFDCRVVNNLPDQLEAVVLVGGQPAFEYDSSDVSPKLKCSIERYIEGTAIKENHVLISVVIYYQVDFAKRNLEQDYRNLLKESGVVISNIRIGNGLEVGDENLTFGSYVNEPGIDVEERTTRKNQFWQVSQYKRDLTYQTVVETPLKNIVSSGIAMKNNYSSGDTYGDMFVTKSMLDPRYNMNFQIGNWDDELNCWTEDDKKTKMLKTIGREYLGMGSCSNQLSLIYRPIDVGIGYETLWNDLDGNKKMDNGERYEDTRVVARRVNPEDGLNYQMVEVVKNINRFESSIKHKSNVFSVVVENSNLAKSSKDEDDMTEEERELEKYKEKLRDSVTQFVRNTCEGIVPVHTQLFDVQFT